MRGTSTAPEKSSEILVVGSLAYDSISTPHGRRERTLGGSANYFSLAASLMARSTSSAWWARITLPPICRFSAIAASAPMDCNVVAGETFFWEGRYENAMNEAITMQTQLNVFENFRPEIPTAFRRRRLFFSPTSIRFCSSKFSSRWKSRFWSAPTR